MMFQRRVTAADAEKGDRDGRTLSMGIPRNVIRQYWYFQRRGLIDLETCPGRGLLHSFVYNIR